MNMQNWKERFSPMTIGLLLFGCAFIAAQYLKVSGDIADFIKGAGVGLILGDFFLRVYRKYAKR